MNFNFKDWILRFVTKENQEEELIQERRTLELTPLDSFSVNFINIGKWEDKKDKSIDYAIPAIDTCLKSINSKKSILQKNPPKLYQQIENINSEKQRNCAILIDLYNRYLLKIEKYKLKLYDNSINYCTQLKKFIENVLEHNYPIKVDYNGFTKKINEYIEKSPKVKKYNIFVKHLYKRISVPSIPNALNQKEILKAITKVMPEYIEEAKFIQENSFDAVFEDFIKENKSFLQTYNEILSEMSLFEYNKSLEDLLDLTKQIAKKVEVDDEDKNEYWIIFHASVRYFFNQVTVQLPYILTNDLSAENFIKNCDIIQSKSPKELKAQRNIFLLSQYETPISTIFFSNEKLVQGIEYLRSIQFYNSPLDIAFLADKALSMFKEVIIENLYRNKNFNGDPNIPVPKDVNLTTILAFDDIFTFFYMGLSIYPPANATALLVFLVSFGKFDQIPSIEYASTTLQAAVRYICDY